ncbi:MAG: leucine-rich repeat protein [Ruminococcus sp.]|nr:leucine-rich repeat protein [Ruminococcus sp.]
MKTTNRILALLLCVVMMSAVACLSAGAATLFPVGSWVYQKINNDTEFEIYEYSGTSVNVFTPYSNNRLYITSVGERAFSGNTTMQKITLSQYITNISSNAFMNCTALETVVFSANTVTTIQPYAFAGCTALSSISLDETSIDTVSYSAFMNCDSLTEITLPDSVTTIGNSAFAYCDNLAKITIPASVTEIHEDAFYGTDNVVIYCYSDSAAHVYAESNEIEYVLLDPVETYILGDVDNDGDVSVLDTTEVQLIIAQLTEPVDDNATLRGDIDRDGVLSIMDATSIQRYVASYDDELHIGETFEV